MRLLQEENADRDTNGKDDGADEVGQKVREPVEDGPASEDGRIAATGIGKCAAQRRADYRPASSSETLVGSQSHGATQSFLRDLSNGILRGRVLTLMLLDRYHLGNGRL